MQASDNYFNSFIAASQDLTAIIPLEFLDTPFGTLDFSLYEKILRKDAHIFSLFQTRKHAILAKGFDVIAASSSTQDQKILAFVQANMDRIFSFQEDLYEMLSALEYGFSVMEIFYAQFKGQIWINELRFRHPSRFRFNHNLDLLWVDAYEKIIRNCTKESKFQFMVYRSGGNDARPYGESLLTERIFWLFYYKKNILEFLMSFIERFAHPIPVFRYPENLSLQDHKALDTLMHNFHQELAAKIPKSVDFNFLEWKGDRSSSLLHENVLRWLNSEISKAILGQTLTSEVPNTGSYAQSKVHENIFHEIIQFDAVRLESTLNSQLIFPLVYLNFGVQKAYPKLRFRYKNNAQDWKDLIYRDQILHNMGLRFPLEYFEKNYSLSSLSFHDSYYRDAKTSTTEDSHTSNTENSSLNTSGDASRDAVLSEKKLSEDSESELAI